MIHLLILILLVLHIPHVLSWLLSLFPGKKK